LRVTADAKRGSDAPEKAPEYREIGGGWAELALSDAICPRAPVGCAYSYLHSFPDLPTASFAFAFREVLFGLQGYLVPSGMRDPRVNMRDALLVRSGPSLTLGSSRCAP
jgi:hypothetical protein